MRARVHLACLLALGAVGATTAIALDRLVAASRSPVQAWVLTSGRPDALAQVLRPQGLLLLDAWWRGRLLLVRGDAATLAHLPRATTWLVWRAPPALAGFSGCGG